MSQFTRRNIGTAPVGPYVATLTGDDSIAVPASMTNNIFVVGDGINIETTGDAVTNTLTISLIDNIDVTVSTTNNTPTLAYTLATTTNTSYAIFVKVAGAYANYSLSLSQGISAAGLNDGGTVSVVGNSGSSVFNGTWPANVGPTNPNRYGVSFTVSGADILINVTGVAATDLNWAVNIQYYRA